MKAVNFKSQKAMLNVFLYEKKARLENKDGLMGLYEPSLDNVIELIKLGSNAETDNDAMEIFKGYIDEGKELIDVAIELIEDSAHLTPAGRKGIDIMVKELREGLSKLSDMARDKQDEDLQLDLGV